MILSDLTGGPGYGHAYGVSADGFTTVGVSDSTQSTPGAFEGEACRWRTGVPEALGDLPGGVVQSIAWDCDTAGSVIVGEGQTVAGTEAFLWDESTGMRRLQDVLSLDYGLDLTGWTLERARAITPCGTVIVGTGVNPSGDLEGWIARLEDQAPVSYCTAGISASGCQASLSASGVASASASAGFALSSSNTEGAKAGIFFFGANGRQANTWGNGTSFQCVAPPVKRAGLVCGDGTAGQCDGSFQQDLNALWCLGCPKPGHNPGVGTVVQAQLWYRDPFNTSNQTTSLSDAIEFTVAP